MIGESSVGRAPRRSAIRPATVEVSVPAQPALVATVRSVARAASVLAELPLGDIEELQIAVDEAAILLLPLVRTEDPDGQLRARFEIATGRVRIVLDAQCRQGATVDTQGMAWMVLSGLDPGVHTTCDQGSIAIAFERGRDDRSPAPHA